MVSTPISPISSFCALLPVIRSFLRSPLHRSTLLPQRCSVALVSGQGGGPRYPPTPGRHRAARGWWGGCRVSAGKMAALASSLIRQRREVKDPQANRPIASKRKPCPKSNKSLCQKQILILISKVRLCGSRGRKMEKRPGEFPKRPSYQTLSTFFLFTSPSLLHFLLHFLPVLNNWILMVKLPDYWLILNCKASIENTHSFWFPVPDLIWIWETSQPILLVAGDIMSCIYGCKAIGVKSSLMHTDLDHGPKA